jgi:hypothetical protein
MKQEQLLEAIKHYDHPIRNRVIADCIAKKNTDLITILDGGLVPDTYQEVLISVQCDDGSIRLRVSPGLLMDDLCIYGCVGFENCTTLLEMEEKRSRDSFEQELKETKKDTRTISQMEADLYAVTPEMERLMSWMYYKEDK